MVPGRCLGHVVEHRLDHGGVELLGSQTVAAAEDLGRTALLGECGTDIHIQRIAQGAGLFGPIENGNGLGALGNGGHQMLRREGAEQAHFDQADFFALAVEVVDHLFDGLTGRPHGDDHFFGVGSADVIEKVVSAAGQGTDLAHIVGHDARQLQVKALAASRPW
jgi:hypothetical protein